MSKITEGLDMDARGVATYVEAVATAAKAAMMDDTPKEQLLAASINHVVALFTALTIESRDPAKARATAHRVMDMAFDQADVLRPAMVKKYGGGE